MGRWTRCRLFGALCTCTVCSWLLLLLLLLLLLQQLLDLPLLFLHMLLAVVLGDVVEFGIVAGRNSVRGGRTNQSTEKISAWLVGILLTTSHMFSCEVIVDK